MDDYDQANDSGGMRADERDSAPRQGKPDPTDKFSALTFKQVFGQTRMAMAVSDPNLEDNPLVYVNEAFCRLTGYSREEAEGRNCRFLQGPETDPKRIREIRTALDEEAVIVTELKNYRKDGTPFWNALHVGPIYDADGSILYHFGSQWDVSDVKSARAEEKTANTLARELSHRMKNMFSVMNAIVGMTGRTELDAEAAASKISGRIMALGRAHEATLATASGTEPVDLGPMLETVLRPYAAADSLSFEGPPIRLDSNLVSMLGLTLHELAINAIKHGALSDESGDNGAVALTWSVEGSIEEERLSLSWQERGGPKVAAPSNEGGGAGRSIVRGLLQAAGGTIDYDWDPAGLTVNIGLPLPGTDDHPN